jgi:hypothetical protein
MQNSLTPDAFENPISAKSGDERTSSIPFQRAVVLALRWYRSLLKPTP